MRGLDEELLGASAKRDRSSHGNTWFSPSGTQSVGDLRRAESAGGSAKTEGCEAFVGAFAETMQRMCAHRCYMRGRFPLYGCEARVQAVAETDGPSRCGGAVSNSSKQSTPQSPVSSRTIPHTTNRVGGPAARARRTADGWTPRDADARRGAAGARPGGCAGCALAPGHGARSGPVSPAGK